MIAADSQGAGLKQDLITDFVSLGSPMYFADRLSTKNRADFAARPELEKHPMVKWPEIIHRMAGKSRAIISPDEW